MEFEWNLNFAVSVSAIVCRAFTGGKKRNFLNA